jgi:hypothetical protein
VEPDPIAALVGEVSEVETVKVSETGIDLLQAYTASSKRLAQNLYSRSGVYLFVGVFIAATGLAFFYSLRVPATSPDLVDRLFTLVPNFGILIFIELLAFFFLRQYRSAMDEFRHYEAIQRRREEVFVLIKLLKEPELKTDVAEIVKSACYFSSGGKLLAGETTEIIEARKLERSDLEIFDKFIDLAGKLKGA